MTPVNAPKGNVDSKELDKTLLHWKIRAKQEIVLDCPFPYRGTRLDGITEAGLRKVAGGETVEAVNWKQEIVFDSPFHTVARVWTRERRLD